VRRQTLTIEAMGARGEGVAHDSAGEVVYVPYTLPGEIVEADVNKGRGRLVSGWQSRLMSVSRHRAVTLANVAGARYSTGRKSRTARGSGSWWLMRWRGAGWTALR
jgi:tRNA/tmRNA/rRNA uracil-C5-methylase (TrmA/RlmC/RlmD family)